MNKFTFDFINDLKNQISIGNFQIDKPMKTVISKEFFEQDPNFTELNKELNKIGLCISKIEIKSVTILCEITKLNT